VLATAPVNGVVRYDEEIHIGYRAWLRAGVEPAYPFGHGLGYTSWELADLQVTPGEDGVYAIVQIRNTGERSGKQVVQVYLSRANGEVDRPVRWLAGFACVRAEPGAEETARITLPSRAFAHWDRGWQVEAGAYTVHAGFRVDDLLRSTDVAIQP
jgi:beta-glucosidase